MIMTKVIVLFEGYAKELDDGKMNANCSCTLIKGEKLIIVDTMTAWDKDKIINGLSENGLIPDDINIVICTHGHADHIGNNNLFTNAEFHMIGTCIYKGTIFSELKDGKNSPDNKEVSIFGKDVEVIATPGHTHDDVSIIVKTKIDGTNVKVGIVGDLFEREEDIEDMSIWKSLGMSNLYEKQIENRLKIINCVDYIIPGHGPMFKLTENMKKKVLADSQFQVD